MDIQQHNIAYVKRQAKKIKKESGVSHIEALDMVSKACGFSNWTHCQRTLKRKEIETFKTAEESVELSFTNWLKRHANRNSPLGDLARDMIDDKTWPSYDSVSNYLSYLYSKGACFDAVQTLNKAWKTYQMYLKKEKTPNTRKETLKKPAIRNQDSRKIVYIKDVTPIPYTSRSVERFVQGDKAWISWNGRKAIPVTVIEEKEERYSLRVERPMNKAGNIYSLFLDEVRSTPELACINHVTW
jgi:uncharacterized protein YozE (UPF0346 family)